MKQIIVCNCCGNPLTRPLDAEEINNAKIMSMVVLKRDNQFTIAHESLKRSKERLYVENDQLAGTCKEVDAMGFGCCGYMDGDDPSLTCPNRSPVGRKIDDCCSHHHTWFNAAKVTVMNDEFGYYDLALNLLTLKYNEADLGGFYYLLLLNDLEGIKEWLDVYAPDSVK